MKFIRKMMALACAITTCAWASNAVAQDKDMDMPGHEHEEHGSMEPDAMSSPLGSYAMTRDASGTSWQPDASPAMSGHVMNGEWMVMRHAMLNLVYDKQGGPRGDEQTFAAGMVMLGAQRDVGSGKINLRAALSPDPFMGPRGYPLLLQTGETADGVSHLVDRQHPHDLFMELSASYSHPLSENRSLFLYVGLPGEPAFGPPAFMHRQAGMDSPEAPTSHHWLDSSHITFGVATAGYVAGNWKVEASSFRGREPDERRYDIETPKLDSWSTRLSWNPGPNWAAQVSYADIRSPEQLDPLEDETRTSASLLYARDQWSATLAWGAKKSTGGGSTANAFLMEAAWKPVDRWTLFTRAEQTQQDELDALHTPYRVGKLSVGAVYDVPLNDHASLGLGGLISAYDIPAGLAASYGGSPSSGMAFLRLRLH